MTPPVVHVLRRRAGEDADAPVRALLAEVLGADEHAVVLSRAPGGKPVIVAPPTSLRVSVAHTGQLVVVALADGVEVGIDVESLERDTTGWCLPRHALAPSERERLERTDTRLRGSQLLRAWVRKEALLKAAGTGLAVDPRDVELSADGRVCRVPPVLGPASLWTVRDVPLEGYALAIAAKGTIETVAVSLLVHAG